MTATLTVLFLVFFGRNALVEIPANSSSQCFHNVATRQEIHEPVISVWNDILDSLPVILWKDFSPETRDYDGHFVLLGSRLIHSFGSE